VAKAEKNMNRKITVLTLCAMLFALCSSAEAQQPKKVHRIGYLVHSDPASESARDEGIRLALRERGYIEGQNITTEYRYGEGKADRFPELAAPKLARVAVLYDPVLPGSVREVKEVLPVAARALKLTLQPWEVRATDDFDRVFTALNKQRPHGLYVPASGPLMAANRKRIADFALKGRLPSVYNARAYVDAGGLMSYNADPADSYRRIAYYMDRILKGAKPADLPVERPTKFELVINLKTAKQIGLTIPQSMLYRADKVIK
jgi:ABC-type uncharacterized transport system substrate-binding protein